MKLSKDDYINILNFYNLKYSKNKSIKTLKNITEKILIKKLCTCIKKLSKKNHIKSSAIAICNNSIIKKKNLGIYKFTCKKKEFKLKNTSKLNTDKIYKTTNKKIYLNPKNVKKTRKNKTTYSNN